MTARARRGAALAHSAPANVHLVRASTSVADETRELATHILHAAQLALITADGDEPQQAADYLLDTLDDLRDRLAALRHGARTHAHS